MGFANIPYEYDIINLYNSNRSPNSIHCDDTFLTNYFRRYLLQKVISVYEWKNIPETWSKTYFYYVLYGFGFIGVLNTAKYGTIPQMGTLKGFDIFYQPTNIVITNPLLPEILEPRIGKDCELIKMQPDYGSCLDIICHYADLLALTTQTLGVDLINSKLAYVFTAQNKANAESFKKIFDKIASGEPAVVYDKDLLNSEGKPNWSTFTQNLSQNYIGDKLLDDYKKILDMFVTEVGIPNANTQKKERLITDEVNQNNIGTQTKAELWLETMLDGCKKVNKMFGLDLNVELRFKKQLEAIRDEFDGEDDRDVLKK